MPAIFKKAAFHLLQFLYLINECGTQNTLLSYTLTFMSEDQKAKIKQLARQIKHNPGDSFSKFALALEFRKEGEFKKARILFEDILTSDSDYVGVYYHLGKLYEALDRLNDARELYQKGITIAANQNEARTESELKEALTQLENEMEERSS